MSRADYLIFFPTINNRLGCYRYSKLSDGFRRPKTSFCSESCSSSAATNAALLKHENEDDIFYSFAAKTYLKIEAILVQLNTSFDTSCIQLQITNFVIKIC